MSKISRAQHGSSLEDKRLLRTIGLVVGAWGQSQWVLYRARLTFWKVVVVNYGKFALDQRTVRLFSLNLDVVGGGDFREKLLK